MQGTDIFSTGPTAFGVIAERFRRAGQPEKAVALCREGLEAFPDHLSARVTLGWSLLDMGEHQEAFDQLKSVLKRAPDNLAAIRGLAELHEQGIGLVFDSLSDEELDPIAEPMAVVVAEPMDFDPIVEPDPELFGDLDPIVEPERFAIEDVIADAEEPASAFDLLGFLPAREPISLYGSAPLALRDVADAAVPGEMNELHDWLSRIRDRRTDSVSEYMVV